MGYNCCRHPSGGTAQVTNCLSTATPNAWRHVHQYFLEYTPQGQVWRSLGEASLHDLFSSNWLRLHASVQDRCEAYLQICCPESGCWINASHDTTMAPCNELLPTYNHMCHMFACVKTVLVCCIRSLQQSSQRCLLLCNLDWDATKLCALPPSLLKARPRRDNLYIRDDLCVVW